jgi:hypothetical protein
MSQQSPMQIQQRWTQAATSEDLDAFDEIIAPDIVDHDLAPGQAPRPAGYKTFFSQLRAPRSPVRRLEPYMGAGRYQVRSSRTTG